MPSVVVASNPQVPHTRSLDLKPTPRRTATYTLDLPLSSDFTTGIKPSSQSGKPGALDDEVNLVVVPCSEEESSSLSSSSNDHHDLLLAGPSPLLDTLSDPGHFAVSVHTKKLSLSVSPHLTDKQEVFPSNCKLSTEVSENPRA